MNTTVSIEKETKTGRILSIDIIALAAMYLMPGAAHLLSFPLYLLEPIRIFTILAILYTNRYNAFILAATLPLFSFFVSGHPVLFKMMVITIEMLLNVLLFYSGIKLIRNKFISMAAAIILSKLVYYSFEYFLLKEALIPSDAVGHPLLIQVGLVLVLSLGTLLFFRENDGKA